MLRSRRIFNKKQINASVCVIVVRLISSSL